MLGSRGSDPFTTVRPERRREAPESKGATSTFVRVAFALALTALAARAASADDAAGVDLRNRAGVAAIGSLPVGDWRDGTGPGGGAAAWLEVPVSPSVAITARAGAIVHAPVTVELGARAWLVEAPLLGGVRVTLARRGRVRVSAGADLGLVVARQQVSLGRVTEADTTLRFGGALALGLAIDRVSLEAGPWFADLGDVSHAIGVQLAVGVRLRSW